MKNWIIIALMVSGVLYGSAGYQIVRFDTPECSFIPEGGHHRIEIEGYVSPSAPGGSRLPVAYKLVALPPGANAVSARLVSSRIDQTGDGIAPVPSAGVFIPGIMEYPDPVQERPVVELHASGTLGGISYACLAFSPLVSDPAGDGLLFHSSAVAEILYENGQVPERIQPRFISQASELLEGFSMVQQRYQALVETPGDDVYDYVIITTEDLSAVVEATAFTEWKTDLGFTVRTVLLSDPLIADQPGSDTAAQIRNFLREYYQTWDIRYVLFVGDHATVPMQICYPDSTYHVYDPSNPGLVGPGTPTDAYYADLSLPDSESWDLDGDGYTGEFGQDMPDFLAEIAVGRIPTSDPVWITAALNKSVTFEQDNGSWKNNVLHVGTILFFENQNHGGNPLVDGAVLLDSMETALMNGMNITHMSEQWGLQKSLLPWPAASQAAFSGNWRDGEFAVVNWSGHGWPNGAARSVWAWDDGDGVPETANGEINSIYFINVGTTELEDDHPSVVFAISCDVGYPEPNQWGNCGIDLLAEPAWGSSVGMVSASRPAAVSGDWKNEPGGTEQICYEFNRYLLTQGMSTGEALYAGKFHATTHYGWTFYYEYINLFDFNLFGDPSLLLAGYPSGVSGEEGLQQPFSVLTNPVRGTASFRITSAAAGNSRLRIFDLTGRLVTEQSDLYLPQGSQQVDLDCTGFAPGTYFAVLEVNDSDWISKLVVLR